MNISKFSSGAAAALVLFYVSNTALANGDYFVDPGLSGTTQYDGWAPLTSAAYPGYGGFPGSGSWPAPMGSNTPDSEDATLRKVANGPGGGPYPAGGGIYYGGFSADLNIDGGQLAVEDSTPVANLANVVLQIDIGEAWGYDFWNDVLPVLNYNGGSQTLAPTNVVLLDQTFTGTVTMPTGEEPVYRNTHLLQWDLSSISGITSFSIPFNGVQHAQLYALRLDQSDVYSAYSQVPEPATASIVALGAVVGGLLVRRRSRV